MAESISTTQAKNGLLSETTAETIRDSIILGAKAASRIWRISSQSCPVASRIIVTTVPGRAYPATPNLAATS